MDSKIVHHNGRIIMSAFQDPLNEPEKVIIVAVHLTRCYQSLIGRM